jgi:hypothetical protein
VGKLFQTKLPRGTALGRAGEVVVAHDQRIAVAGDGSRRAHVATAGEEEIGGLIVILRKSVPDQ